MPLDCPIILIIMPHNCNYICMIDCSVQSVGLTDYAVGGHRRNDDPGIISNADSTATNNDLDTYPDKTSGAHMLSDLEQRGKRTYDQTNLQHNMAAIYVKNSYNSDVNNNMDPTWEVESNKCPHTTVTREDKYSINRQCSQVSDDNDDVPTIQKVHSTNQGYPSRGDHMTDTTVADTSHTSTKKKNQKRHRETRHKLQTDGNGDEHSKELYYYHHQ